MPCKTYIQSLYATLTDDPVTFFSDNLLDSPELVDPEDEENICVGYGSSVTLDWNAVTGADFYVVQICLNGSFTGPTFRSLRVDAPTTSYALTSDYVKLFPDVKVYWRVGAFSNSGGVSEKSESRSFNIKCNKPGPPPPAQPGSIQANWVDCEAINAEIEIIGRNVIPTSVNFEGYFATISWQCENENGNTVSFVRGEWSVNFDVANGQLLEDAEDDVSFHISVESVQEHKFTITYCAVFRIDLTGVEFECCVSKDVAVINEIHPQNNPFGPYSYYDCGLIVEDGYLKIDFDEILCGGLKKDDCCLYIYYGCGLTIDENDALKVKNTDLVGPGIIAYGDCGLQVDAGCGLQIILGQLMVDSTDLVGKGITFGDDTCNLQVDYGCGLTFDEDVLVVYTGNYVECDADGALQVKAASKEVLIDTYCLGSYLYNVFEYINILGDP